MVYGFYAHLFGKSLITIRGAITCIEKVVLLRVAAVAAAQSRDRSRRRSTRGRGRTAIEPAAGDAVEIKGRIETLDRRILKKIKFNSFLHLFFCESQISPFPF